MDKFLRARKIKTRFQENIEPHEIFWDSLARKKEQELGISEKKIEVSLSQKILKTFLVLVFISIFALFAKTFQLQILEGKKFSALAQENKFAIFSLQAARGVVYDQEGKQLIFNQPSFDLILDKNSFPTEQDKKDKILKGISEILEKDIGEMEKSIEESTESKILIAKSLKDETLLVLEVKINAGEFPGFQVQRNYTRGYPSEGVFSHLLGYTGKITAEELKADPEDYSLLDEVGRSGLEKSYEEVLRKNPGQLQIEKDALGNHLSQKIIKMPEPGKSLVLWLDADLQKKIKTELEKKLTDLGTRKAAAVAMDPKTGGILALVSLPAFDNNLFETDSDPKALKELLADPQESLLNRVISGRYLTGSTIKPLIASAVLEEKIIDPDKKINDDKGYILIPNPWDPENPTIKKDWTIHGWTDMRKAIAESCNVYFYTLGGGFGSQEGLGVARIKKYLQLFGWDQKTGIDLPGEVDGFVPDKQWKKENLKESWVDGDTYNLAIGQGFIKITPLEVVTAFSAIANGGKLLKPQVIQKIVDSEKKVIEEFSPKVIRENFIDPENLQIVREGMRQAVTGQNSPQASSIILNSLPVASAAKTGTAELGKDYYHNWVTVFAPYDDPQIVLTVMVEKVKGVQAAALPVARGVLEWYFNENKK